MGNGSKNEFDLSTYLRPEGVNGSYKPYLFFHYCHCKQIPSHNITKCGIAMIGLFVCFHSWWCLNQRSRKKIFNVTFVSILFGFSVFLGQYFPNSKHNQNKSTQ